MELETFIAETLTQIVRGIKTAQEELKEERARINPGSIEKHEGLYYMASEHQWTVQMVDFEVLLGQAEGTESKAGFGVFLSAVGVGAQAKTETDSSALNRIKFSIPVAFPPYR